MQDSYTNPYESKRIESFEIFGLTNRNESNLLRFLVLRNESTIRILKVRIRESKTSGFVSAIVLRIRWIRENRSNLWKISLRNESTKRIFWKHEGFVIHDTKRIRIRQSRNETNLLKSGFVIHDTVRIHGFAKRIRVFTNLLYESRNLIINASAF